MGPYAPPSPPTEPGTVMYTRGSHQGDCAPRKGHLAMSGDTCGCHTTGDMLLAAEHPAVHTTAPQTQGSPAPHDNRAEGEKLIGQETGERRFPLLHLEHPTDLNSPPQFCCSQAALGSPTPTGTGRPSQVCLQGSKLEPTHMPH